VEIRSLNLLTAEEIVRRLKRMTGENYRMRPNQITRYDFAKWAGIDVREVRYHSKGIRPITDAWQIVYSQFFQLVDAGELVLQQDKRTKTKTLVRVPAPPVPPKRTLQPAIDFATMRLKLD
jgi:hypothetical protein